MKIIKNFGGKFVLLVIIFGASACGGSGKATSHSGNSNQNNTSGANAITRFDSPNHVDAAVLVENYNYFGRGEINQEISSDITGVTYDYHVYLPPEYDLEPERNFPVIYITDAQYDVSFQAKVIDYENRDLIMVGISEGPPGRRATDYILPGGRSYFQFFTEEFIPQIESQYRIDPLERTFEGSSAGGMASLIMMFMDQENPPIFKHHFSFDPYINVSALNALINERLATGVPMNKTLFVNSMSGGFMNTVVPFTQTLRARNIEGLTIHERVYDYEHTDATWVSFSLALRLAYGPRD